MLSVGLGRWELALGRGQLIYGNVADFEHQEREFLAALGVVSTVIAPVFVGREWWGYVSLEDYTAARDWPDVELDGITAAAGILGAAIQKKRGEDAEKRVAQMKDDFIATVSHELRTPLFALQGFLDLLRSGKVQHEATRQEFLATAAQNAQRLMALVNDLLDISRLESGRTKLDLTSVDIGELISETLESLRSLVSDKQITLIHDIPEAPAALTVVADRAKLRQVLVNLVGNAVKFSDPRESVVVSAALDGDNVKIAVTDHGPGIAREDLPRLFSKFYQAEKPLTRTTGGAGLGLYISKQIIEAHGGVMGVESVLGEGSTFYFVVPTASPDTVLSAAAEDDPLYGPRSFDMSKEARWLM
jgi:two-component system phosphate regulon sensor histidine kinase PhoR